MQLFRGTYLAYRAISALTEHYALSIFFQVERQNKRRMHLLKKKKSRLKQVQILLFYNHFGAQRIAI